MFVTWALFQATEHQTARHFSRRTVASPTPSDDHIFHRRNDLIPHADHAQHPQMHPGEAFTFGGGGQDAHPWPISLPGTKEEKSNN